MGLFLFAAGFLLAAAAAPAEVARSLPFLSGLGFNTALCVGLLGLSLAAARDGAAPQPMAAHGAVALLAIASLLQLPLGLYPPDGPWRLLLNTLHSDDAWPGRMSVASACTLILYSAAGGLLASRQARLAPVVYLTTVAGVLIPMGSLTGSLVGLVLFAHDRPEAGYMSPASSILLVIAGLAGWQTAGRRPWMRAWREQAPGTDLFVHAASLLATLLVVGGVVSGGLVLEGRHQLAAAIILVLAPAGGAWLYWRIVPTVERIQRAEADLRVASKRQELLLQHAGQGIYGLDGAGCVTFANPAAAGLLGYAADELIGRNMHCLMHSRRHDGSPYSESDCPILTTLADGVSRHVENEVFWKSDGSALEVEYDVAALREGERITGAVILFSDVGARRRLLADLGRWKQIFEHAEWGVAIGSADGKTLELVNQAFARMHGYSQVELIGSPIADVFAPQARADFSTKLKRIHEDGHLRFESQHIRKDGMVFPVLIDATAVYDETGRATCRVANVLDMTEQVAREDRLRRSEATLAQAQAQAHLGSWWLDIPNNVLEWSEESYRIFGVPFGTPQTYESFLACVHPDDRAYVDAQWRAGVAGAPYDIQHRLLVNGQVKWVRERADLEFHADGSLWRGVGTTQDITELKLKEEELLHSRQLLRDLAAHHEIIREEERRRIAREVHDVLGQYLTALRMDVAMLSIRFGDGHPDLEPFVLNMKKTIDTTIGVVRDVTTSLRPGTLDMGLVSAAEWLLAGFEERTGILCRLESPNDNLGLDDARVTAAFRILQESLTNIAKHAQASEVQVTLARAGDQLSMQVRDDGVGFDMEDTGRRKTFGLMGIRERALMFGGNVRIHSSPGAGTSLNVTIPLQDEPAAS